jgi:hypothetical protein
MHQHQETTMANTDDTSKTQSQLEQAIETERARLLQVHSVLHCLYEVLLYADSEEAVTYAEAAHLAAMLIDDVVEQLDPVRLRPMIEAIQRSSKLEGRYAPPEPPGLTSGSKDNDNAVKEPGLPSPYYH